ncbi:squalene synthase HpnC [soil metagenome]
MTAVPIDPAASVMSLLARFGPESGCHEPVSRDAAWGYVRGLASSHYENFSVLSSLVPARLRDDFAAVYAFCRWSDDLGDETGPDAAARERSLRLLGWWREELAAAGAGRATHPVYVALAETIARHRLPLKPFHDLIAAFEQDQTLRHYQTWSELIGYCEGSANPVGRIVLMLAGHRPETEARDAVAAGMDRFTLSDATCTALQLINFWQDVRRDLIERDRVYMPAADCGVSPALLRTWMNRGEDAGVRAEFAGALKPLVDRTRGLFERGAGLPRMLSPDIRPVVRLFGAGGMSVLRSVEAAGYETLWGRPRLSKAKKVSLVARAWVAAKFDRRAAAEPTAGAGLVMKSASESAALKRTLVHARTEVSA